MLLSYTGVILRHSSKIGVSFIDGYTVILFSCMIGRCTSFLSAGSERGA